MRDKYAHNARAVRSYSARKASSSISNTASPAAASARSCSISEIVTSGMIGRRRIQEPEFSRQEVCCTRRHDEPAAERQGDNTKDAKQLGWLVDECAAHVEQSDSGQQQHDPGLDRPEDTRERRGHRSRLVRQLDRRRFEEPPAQIGRASCRERVYSSEVAVSWKRKSDVRTKVVSGT